MKQSILFYFHATQIFKRIMMKGKNLFVQREIIDLANQPYVHVS